MGKPADSTASKGQLSALCGHELQTHAVPRDCFTGTEERGDLTGQKDGGDPLGQGEQRSPREALNFGFLKLSHSS